MFPALFFNNRGANFSSPGTGFRNSDNDFSDLNPDYAAQFEPFSKPKTFMFDAAGRSLGKYLAPVRSDATSLSFVGVVFDAAIIAKVVITSGQATIDAGLQDITDGGNRDLVVTDDFLYGEPNALQ